MRSKSYQNLIDVIQAKRKEESNKLDAIFKKINGTIEIEEWEKLNQSTNELMSNIMTCDETIEELEVKRDYWDKLKSVGGEK